MSVFAKEVSAIAAKQSTIQESADRLYDALSEEERLYLLDGDVTTVGWGIKVASEGYCGKPHEAGVIDRLGIPGIRFSDGPRGIIEGTAFPCPSSRAASFDPSIEEEIVSSSVIF
jgi:beta-glucosidase